MLLYLSYQQPILEEYNLVGHVISYKAGTEGMKSINISVMQVSLKQKAIIYMTLMST